MTHAICIKILQPLRGVSHTMAYNRSCLSIAASEHLTILVFYHCFLSLAESE